MSLSRRSLLTGGLGAASIVGLSALTGCSTSAPSNNASTSANASGSAGGVEHPNKIMWMWPDGFGKAAMANVAKEKSQYQVRQDIIGGDFKQKLTTTFAAKSGMPDITGIKGQDMPFFRTQADYFMDLKGLGADEFKADYLEWKWNQGITTDGKMIGFPIDTGPTGLFYRADIFEKAGLTSDPDKLAEQIKGWDDYFELGKQLIGKLPETYLVRNAGGIFDIAWAQSGQGFINESDDFIGDQDHIRNAWDIAVKAFESGIDGNIQSDSTDSQAAVNAGKLPTDIGASWHLADLVNDSPSSSGKWRVCRHPGVPVNSGGSFLAIPEGAVDPQGSMDIITYLLNAENQALEFADKGNFPSTPASYEMKELTQPVEFLGGQVAGKVFGDISKDVKQIFEHAHNNTVNAPYFAELKLVENKQKTSDQAWNDAVTAAKRIAKQTGLKVK